MSEAVFWRLCGVLLLVMGVIAAATALALRWRRQPWRVPLLYAALAVGVGLALEVVLR